MADEQTLEGSRNPAVPPNCISPALDGAYPAGSVVRSNGTAGASTQAAANVAASARAIGIMLHATSAAGDHALVQYAGVVTLPTAAWDAIAGTSGGLTPNTPYFLSNTLGHLATSAGTVAVQIGIALSPTALMLQIEKSPSVNP